MALNHITIMGRLAKDPELRKTPNGTSVTCFTLAVDRDFSKGETDFIECVAWRATADFVANHFTKGKMAIVSGRLQIRGWVDKDENKRKNAEVIAEQVYFGESKKEAVDNSPGENFTNDAPRFDLLSGDDSELPF